MADTLTITRDQAIEAAAVAWLAARSGTLFVLDIDAARPRARALVDGTAVGTRTGDDAALAVLRALGVTP